MSTGICQLAVIPLRAEPSSKSEILSQLLFGERYTVLEQQEDWVKVSTLLESYEGWISASQHFPYSGEPNMTLVSDTFPFLEAIEKKNSIVHRIPTGALLHDVKPGTSQFTFNCGGLELEAPLESIPNTHSTSEVIDLAMKFMNAPYLWGGRTFMGIDCSGFSQIIFRLMGVAIDRDAWQQALQGTVVDFLEEARPGDLAFFDNEAGRITHVGILMGDGNIIHASGKVRIDPIDHHGIFRPESAKHSHRLRVVKRYW